MNTLTLVETLFSFYSVLIFTRIALSWFPMLYKYKATRWVILATDPYMNVFKRIIPPIGGVLDLSPMIALIALRFIQTLLTSLLV